MPREAGLFEAANGSVVDAFFILTESGGNIPPNWIDRSSASRTRRQKELGKLLKSKDLAAVPKMKEWELAYRKECFYYGLRALLELARSGKTRL
mgnify:FL=1